MERELNVDIANVHTIENVFTEPGEVSPFLDSEFSSFSRRAGVETSPARRPLTHLGQLSVEATYGPGDMSDGAVAAAESHRDEVVDAVNELTTTSERLKDALDPRPLVKR